MVISNEIFTLLFLCLFLVAFSFCSGIQERDKEKEIKNSFIEFVRSGDENIIMRYIPDDFEDFRITVEGGSKNLYFQSYDDLEDGIGQFLDEIEGESLKVVQESRVELIDSVVYTFTLKIINDGMERVVPVRVVIDKGNRTSTLAIRGFGVY